MPMYNLIKYSNIYSKTFNNAGAIIDFPANNNSVLLSLKKK